MKKHILLFVFLLNIAGCDSHLTSSIYTSSLLTQTPTKTVEEIMDEYTQKQLKCDSYDRQKYLLPIWESDIIYNETALFVNNQDSNFPIVKLSFPIAKVLEVRDSTLKILYEEGKDYQIVDGGIQLLEGTRINNLKYDQFYLSEEPSSSVPSISHPGKYCLNDPELYTRSTCITYIRTQKYDGPIIESNTEKLPITMKKLDNKEKLKIVYYGDSITTGACTSGWYGVNKAPYTPIYTDMITTELKEFYNYSNIIASNTAQGGWTANDGAIETNINERVKAHNPDLMVIAFGMNDGHNGSFTVENYQSQIEKIMLGARSVNENCEFILVAPMLSNPDRDVPYKRQNECKIGLQNLVEKYQGTSMVDLTSMCEWLLERKEYRDFTDGIVHPTDFMSRIYAQVVISSLIEGYSEYMIDCMDK